MIMFSLTELIQSIDATTVFLALLGILIISYVYNLMKGRSMPPGPLPWPIVGHSLSLTKYPHKKLAQLAKIYGDVFTIYIGSQPVIIINGGALAKEVLVKNSVAFAGRPNTPMMSVFQAPDGSKDLVATQYNDEVKLFRKMSINALRNVTSLSNPSYKQMEERVTTEVFKLIEEIDSYHARPCYFGDMIAKAITRSLFSILIGPNKVDENLQHIPLDTIVNNLKVSDKVMSIGNFLDIMPWLSNIILKFPNEAVDVFRTLSEKISTLISVELEEHKQSLHDDSCQDIMYHLLKARQEVLKEKNLNNSQLLDDHYLATNARGLFIAGIQTVPFAIEWFLLNMIAFPDIQQNVHEELDKVVGKGRYPSITDRSQLIYLEACILETLRFSPVTAFGIPHACSKDTELNGFKIAKETIVWVNLWSVHHDENCWKDAEKFNPDRFIIDGQLIKSAYFVPFSSGSRSCTGEILARYQVFLYVSLLMHHFTFKKDSVTKYDVEDVVPGLSSPPAYFEGIAIPRTRDCNQ